MIWALLEDLLLVQLGLVVGRVALVEVGHRRVAAALRAALRPRAGASTVPAAASLGSRKRSEQSSREVCQR